MSMDKVLERKLAGLYSRKNDGIKFGLEVQQSLMRGLGSPHDKYAVVHVAGTNGKGSVCAMLASVLSKAGLRTGLYISPHLVEFNERISVDGQRVTDDDLLALSGLLDAQLDRVERECGRQPTFFEYATGMAMKHFEQQRVQVAVFETGMGGRLDATNIVTPLVSIITRISLEHSKFLGDTLEMIAGEKAGIIKKGRPVICGAMPDDARAVIRKKTAEMGCVFRDAEETVSAGLLDFSLQGQKLQVSSTVMDYGRINLNLIGEHQLENCSTAVAAIEEIERALGIDLPEEAIKIGLESVSWQGRCQPVSEDPPVILDGAHNPGASAALGNTLKKLFAGKPLGLVLGMCADKDVASFIEGFHGVSKIWTVTIDSDRAVPAEQLAAVVKARGIDARAVSLCEAMEAAEQWARECDGAVCVTGSLFLVGEVLDMERKDEQRRS